MDLWVLELRRAALDRGYMEATGSILPRKSAGKVGRQDYISGVVKHAFLSQESVQKSCDQLDFVLFEVVGWYLICLETP